MLSALIYTLITFVWNSFYHQETLEFFLLPLWHGPPAAGHAAAVAPHSYIRNSNRAAVMPPTTQHPAPPMSMARLSVSRCVFLLSACISSAHSLFRPHQHQHATPHTYWYWFGLHCCLINVLVCTVKVSSTFEIVKWIAVVFILQKWSNLDGSHWPPMNFLLMTLAIFVLDVMLAHLHCHCEHVAQRAASTTVGAQCYQYYRQSDELLIFIFSNEPQSNECWSVWTRNLSCTFSNQSAPPHSWVFLLVTNACACPLMCRVIVCWGVSDMEVSPWTCFPPISTFFVWIFTNSSAKYCLCCVSVCIKRVELSLGVELQGDGSWHLLFIYFSFLFFVGF